METTVDEIADNIFRIGTFVPEAGMSLNQILVNDDEPFLFHTGMRALFPLTVEAVSTVVSRDRLRWISFGHVEADECGALNEWLAVSPSAEVAFGGLGCMVSVNDLSDRPPRALEDGEIIDLGTKRMRYIATPHVPHGWEAGLFYEETTGTLLCGDLFTQLGDCPAISTDSPIEASKAAEDAFGYTTMAPNTVPTLRALAELKPNTLALMHGATHKGDGELWLNQLADSYAERIEAISSSAAA